MICGSCERRVDPNRSFCTNCGSSVFIDERDARSMLAVSPVRASSPTRSTFLDSLQDKMTSLQTSAQTFEESARRTQASAKSVDRAARRARARAATAKQAAASFSIAPLIKFVIFAVIVWNVGKWLLAIPEVLVLKDRVQAGHFSDADLQAARDAIGERIQTFLRNAQNPNPPPRDSPEPATAERPAPVEPPGAPAARRQDTPAPSVERPARGVQPDVLVFEPTTTVTLPPGVSLPGDEVSLPRVLQHVPAAYTPEAMRAKVEGLVILQAVVRTHGMATNIEVVQSLDDRFGLDEQAIAAVRQWRFAPGLRAGQPVPVLVQIAIKFSLR